MLRFSFVKSVLPLGDLRKCQLWQDEVDRAHEPSNLSYESLRMSENVLRSKWVLHKKRQNELDEDLST